MNIENKLPKYEMNDAKFNRSLYGYLIKSMMLSNFSRNDIDRIIRIVQNNGFEWFTVAQAEQFYLDVQAGKVDFTECEKRKNRILENEE